MSRTIPPAAEQLQILAAGAVDLNPREEFEDRLNKSHATQTPLVVKTGFDPTAPDIHLGHWVLLEKMAQFQRLGHDVVFLVGDYTARIGDPTGRNSMRPPLSEEEINANAKTYTDQVFKLLDPKRTRVEWNSKWLSELKLQQIIELTAKYNVGRMLERRDFRTRFDNNKQIALHEFLYPLLQGYDSVALKADIELGGHDQIFNLNVGRHLMEAYGLKPQCVLTVALLVGVDGVEKMSKSKGNHIGIHEPPEQIFGKIMSISDETMAAWMPLLTGTPLNPQTDQLSQKKDLAETMLRRLFDQNIAQDIRQWWDAGRPPRNLTETQVSTGPLFRIVCEAGLASSNNEARRKISQGGVSINDVRIDDPNHLVVPGKYLLQVGKKSFVTLNVT